MELDLDERVEELEEVVFSRYVELESVELVLDEDLLMYVELESVLDVDHSSNVELLSDDLLDTEESDDQELRLTSEFVLSELVLHSFSVEVSELGLLLERLLELLSVDEVLSLVCARIVELVDSELRLDPV